jgi:hypothetical protein
VKCEQCWYAKNDAPLCNRLMEQKSAVGSAG